MLLVWSVVCIRLTSGRPLNGRLFRRDFVVWQMLQFSMCALNQQMNSAGGDAGRYG